MVVSPRVFPVVALLVACGETPGAQNDASVATDAAIDAEVIDADADAIAPPEDATASNAPAQAAAAGYTVNTFSSQLAKSGIDVANTQTSGFQWYLASFFGGPAMPATDLTFNGDGTLTLDGAGTSANVGISTATTAKNSAGWVGVAFGGGAYFEAVFKFNPQDTIATGGKGWPSWWAMAIEHLANLPTQQWQGQPAQYAHFIETDFFEYDIWSFAPHNEYGGAINDWYGIYNSTCTKGFCKATNASGGGTNFNNFVVHTPTNTDYTQYHAVGFLWEPATATSLGRATFYFDGVATNDVVTYSQYAATSPPPPGTAPWTFGILDQQHLAPILGTGANEPMTIQSVNVWQKSAALNLTE